jgi:hypothetical protein
MHLAEGLVKPFLEFITRAENLWQKEVKKGPEFS